MVMIGDLERASIKNYVELRVSDQTLGDHPAFEVHCNGLEGRGGELLSVSEPRRRERVFTKHRPYAAIVEIVGMVMMKLGI